MDQGNRPFKTTIHDFVFDTGLRGEMGALGDYFKSWNWELGFRYSRNEEEAIFGGCESEPNFEPSRVNRDVWAIYQEVRLPVTSPLWNFPGAYSLEFDIAEREEWYSQNTSAVLPIANLPFVPAQHSLYNAQKPKFSVRWQPLDPKWMGPLTFRGSYTEAFHAPTLPDLTPAGTESAL